jgi:hypothetical protein
MIKRFLIDGIIPTSLMIIAGTIGIYIKSIQPAMTVIFGIIFGIKCAWMFTTCLMEYRKCRMDIENYYDTEYYKLTNKPYVIKHNIHANDLNILDITY